MYLKLLSGGDSNVAAPDGRGLSPLVGDVSTPDDGGLSPLLGDIAAPDDRGLSPLVGDIAVPSWSRICTMTNPSMDSILKELS